MAEVKDNPIINHIAAAAQAQASSQQAQLRIQEQLDAQEAASQQAILAATSVGNAQATIKSSEESWKASSDAQIASIGVALGTDWTTQGSESNYWATQMKENAHKAYESLDVIKDKQSKTLLSDPLGFISAQFTLPADIATHNYYARKHNVAEQALNEITNASNSAAIAAKQMEQRTSEAVAEAKANEALANAAKDVANITANAAGNKIKGIVEINSMTAQQADMAFKIHAANNSDAQLALQQRQADDLHAQRMMAQTQRQEQLDAKAATLDDWKAQLDIRNIGAKAMGKAPVTSIDMFRREYNMSGKTQDYQDMLNYGMDISLNQGSLSGVPVAQNAGRAALNYAKGGVNLNGNVAGTFLTQVLGQQKLLPTAPKDQAALAEQVTSVATKIAKDQLASIDNSNPAAPNIYAAPPPSVMLQSKAVQSSPFIMETLVPMLEQNKNLQLPDAVLVAKAADYAKGGKANFNVAVAGIAAYYKQATIINSANNRYVEHDLPKQTSYTARINGADVDLTNETQVKMVLMKAAFAEKFSSFAGISGTR